MAAMRELPPTPVGSMVRPSEAVLGQGNYTA